MLSLGAMGTPRTVRSQPAPPTHRGAAPITLPSPERRVLLLYTEPRLTPAIVAADEQIRTVLESRSPVPVTFYTEYFDLDLFDGDVPQPELRELLRRKYETRRLDLVIAGGSRALRIALRNREPLFAGVPVVFLGVDPRTVTGLELGADVTGAWLRQGWAETLALARRLQPATRRALVIVGSSPIDHIWLDQARRQLASPPGSIETRYLADRAFEEVLREVAALPPHTVVLVGTFLRDPTGRDFLTPQAVARIAATARVPVYGLTEATVGTGAVGGQVVSFDALGRVAAELALRILAGDRPPPTDADTTVAMVDARQLDRWGLDERRLPPGSVVLFREPSLWAQHPWIVVSGTSALLLQSGLIAGLLAQRVKRRRAEVAARRSEAQARDLATRLLTAQEEERRRIARDLHDDVNQELAALSIALSALGGRARAATASDLGDELARLQARTVRLSEAIRHLSHDLHPGVLEHVGLVGALRSYCRDFERKHGLTVTLRGDDELGAVPADISLCLYRVVQEGLANVARHAQARQARVVLERREHDLVLTVSDDGRGFDLAAARDRRGLGLISLDERVRLVGGRLAIDGDSQRGTKLKIVVPLSEARDAPRDRAAG